MRIELTHDEKEFVNEIAHEYGVSPEYIVKTCAFVEMLKWKKSKMKQ